MCVHILYNYKKCVYKNITVVESEHNRNCPCCGCPQTECEQICRLGVTSKMGGVERIRQCRDCIAKTNQVKGK